MGKYLNYDSKETPLPALGKAKALIDDGAQIVDKPAIWRENLVCVANNGFFECAAYLYSEREMEAFTYPDGRPKTYLEYPHAKNLAQ